jgi:hypothetical protein
MAAKQKSAGEIWLAGVKEKKKAAASKRRKTKSRLRMISEKCEKYGEKGGSARGSKSGVWRYLAAKTK